VIDSEAAAGSGVTVQLTMTEKQIFDLLSLLKTGFHNVMTSNAPAF